MEFTTEHLLWAMGLGALSAVSLPMGSVAGLVFKPPKLVTGFLGAFGAGALLAALAIELVAPTVSKVSEGGPHASSAFLALILGSIIGGALFVVLDQLVNAKGGFLRKSATTLSFMTQRRKTWTQKILTDLQTFDLLEDVAVEHIQRLVDCLLPVTFNAGDVLFEQGDAGDRMYLIRSGTVEVLHDNKLLAELESGSILGEIALLTGSPRTAKARAKTSIHTLVLSAADFEELREVSPELDAAVRNLASVRMDELNERRKTQHDEASRWAEETVAALREGARVPTNEEIAAATQEHSGAPLAVWLGILLDGIPESIVIGAGFLGLLIQKSAAGIEPGFADVIPYTLIAGLFLSNFPEAMSSSVGMANQGWSATRIFTMWATLMVIVAIGAGLGYWLGEAVPHDVMIGVEGVAAGAMLTMIVSAMVPEAVHIGGANLAGFSTLVGFLGAIAFKVFE